MTKTHLVCAICCRVYIAIADFILNTYAIRGYVQIDHLLWWHGIACATQNTHTTQPCAKDYARCTRVWASRHKLRPHVCAHIICEGIEVRCASRTSFAVCSAKCTIINYSRSAAQAAGLRFCVDLCMFTFGVRCIQMMTEWFCAAILFLFVVCDEHDQTSIAWICKCSGLKVGSSQ